MRKFIQLPILGSIIVLLVCAAVYADEAPTWLRQAAAASVPAYEKEVSAVVLHNEQQVSLNSDGKTISTRTYAVKLLSRDGRQFAVARAYSAARRQLSGAPHRLAQMWRVRAGMTLATGKGGKYRYYKCSSRTLKGKDTCTSNDLPTEQVDRLILSLLADRVFAVPRVQKMVESLRRRLSQGS